MKDQKRREAQTGKTRRNKRAADTTLELRTSYRVGKGGAWGSYDFWMSVASSLVAAYLFLATNKSIAYLAKRIYQTLKSSRAEKIETESARFDLLIPFDDESLAVLRVMRSAKFRSKEPILESDISSALTIVINRLRTQTRKGHNGPNVVVGELNNMSDGIQLSIHRVEGLESAPALQRQLEEAKRGKVTRVRLK